MSRVNMDPVKHWINGRQVDSVERFEIGRAHV